ncbi:hypothetical protein FJ656_00700 [Schumannella luteola]|uniref:Uncharacterized protein YndB with AHSA1/START domain n=1 Tax=Schumannella luteola TaxID=472059 RepID=A0A852YD35_9MICO|nr:hypothetical protein [Schumannella luteola]NYG99722.1 uncharacterized protein YndB with AHSA1/START domain [Schumannella luteola]TPX06502.1 hypothetical protein FJ656_00700 [Schumannella luteola]
MSAAAAHVVRTIDLPPGIVWEALVDPVLVEGWLHPSLTLLGDGALLVAEEPEVLLEVDHAEFGQVRILLDPVAGGTRGTATVVTVELPALGDLRFSPPIAAGWSVRLHQLADLLRGHPVDWDHWERDRGSEYREQLELAQQRLAH